MNFSELNLDRLFLPSLISIFSPRKETIENPLPIIIEVHSEIDKKVSKISNLSSEIYSTIRQNGDRPFGDIWAEINFSTPETSYWMQADNVGSLIINATSDEERHSLRIQTNNPHQPILHSEIRDIKTSKLKNEESIISPENYSYDGLYEACRLLRKCDSFLFKLYSPIPIESSNVFSRTNLIDVVLP